MNRLIISAFFIACGLRAAVVPPYLPQALQYDPSITTPAAFLGYAIGEHHLTHAELLAYLRLLDRESNRIHMVEIGKSHGRRPLTHLWISTPENLARIEDIQRNRRKLMYPGKWKVRDIEELPVVMNLNYSIHGNEASGSNAAAVVAYYLAAAIDVNDALLENTVIVIDPALNPDGMDRFAHWANRFSGKNPSPDPYSMEHREGWPNGRTNYYGFDLNRDWLLLTQPESRARLEQFNNWIPDLLLDFHEMGTNSTYFFQPGVRERSHPLSPESNFELTKRISRYFAEALDKAGSLYFSEERFDDFYVGKGSTMPDLKGSVGILFEQASARGLVQNSVNGPVTFPFAIQNQVITSLACLKVAREMHDDLLENKRNFFADSLKAAGHAGYAGYKFSSPGDPARAREFVKILEGHDIEVRALPDEQAWYIPLEQPYYQFLESMVEQRTAFKENVFYDITAWTLPLAFNLEWEKLNGAPPTATPPTTARNLESSSLGYIIDWSGLNAPRLLLDLLQEDIIIKVAKNPFRMASREFGYGSIFVPVSLQRDKAARIHEILVDGVCEYSVDVFPVRTFLTESGIDLGSQEFVRIDRPEILLAGGDGMNVSITGSIWHLMDVYYDYPVTLVEATRLNAINLSNYSTIILAGNRALVFNELTLNHLKTWIQKGGTLICLDSSVKWAINNKLVKLALLGDEEASGESTARTRRPFVSAAVENAFNKLPGAIFRTEIDCSHPLAYGYAQTELPVFVSGTTFLAPSENRYQTPMVFASDPLIAGYASPGNLEKLAGSAAAVVESQGQGTVVLFGHNPTFRAYWRGTEKLLVNAMLFGPLMKASDPDAYKAND